MTKRSSFVAALVVLAIASIGIGAATQLALQNDGIKFPDNTVQKTAAETPGIFVQGNVIFGFPDFMFCATGNLYTVPAGKRLRIEWISVEMATAPAGADPIEVDIRTWLNNVQVHHALVRLDEAVNFGESFFFTQRWSSPVTIYNQGNKTIEIFACRDSGGDDSTQIIASFHGQLFNE